MDEEIVQQAALDQSLIEPGTVPATPADKPKRTRRSRAKVNANAAAEAMDVFEDAQVEAATEPKKRTRSRSAKLTGDDVAGGVHLASSLAAMMTQQPHWMIPEAEVKPWAADAAALLNRIPSQYVKAVTDVSGFITVGVGIYGCMKPRLDESARIAAARKREREAAARSLIDSAIPATDQVSWG